MTNNKITIIDKEFHFGIGFLSEIIDGTGLQLEDIGKGVEEGNASIISKMFYFSHLYACKRNGSSTDFTLYDIHDWIEENGGIIAPFVQELITGFLISLTKDVPVDDKKKVKEAKK